VLLAAPYSIQSYLNSSLLSSESAAVISDDFSQAECTCRERVDAARLLRLPGQTAVATQPDQQGMSVCVRVSVCMFSINVTDAGCYG